MPDLTVPWAGLELPVRLPDDWTLHQFAAGQLRGGSDDWPERMAAALNQPDTSKPLARLLEAMPGGRIVLIVEDITRHSPLPDILEVIMREMHHASMEDEQIEIVFATGMHPPMSHEEAVRKIGNLANQLRWRNNPWRDRDRYVRIGTLGKVDYWVDSAVAGADLRILVSAVCPHLQAGFGGGYKMIFPGCAHLDTIRAMHRLGAGRMPRQLVGTDAEKNPLRRAIDTGGRLLDKFYGQTFAVQYLLDDNDRPVHIAAGDPVATQRMLGKQCSAACGIVTQSPPADVLVTNAYPRDFDLWQTLKTVGNTRWAVRPGGVIICLSRCEAGLNGMDPPRWPLSPAWTRRVVRWLGSEALGSLMIRLVPHLSGDAGFFIRMGLQALHRNPIFIVSPAMRESRMTFPGLEVFGDFEHAFAATTALLGDESQRVTVFAAGGTTFPVPTQGPVARAPDENR